jgi:hypothetical protein
MEKENNNTQKKNNIQQGKLLQTPFETSLAGISVTPEVIEFVLKDIEQVMEEFYFSLSDKKDQKKFDKLMKNEDNLKIISSLLMKLYFKQAEKTKPKTREYIG